MGGPGGGSNAFPGGTPTNAGPGGFPFKAATTSAPPGGTTPNTTTAPPPNGMYQMPGMQPNTPSWIQTMMNGYQGNLTPNYQNPRNFGMFAYGNDFAPFQNRYISNFGPDAMNPWQKLGEGGVITGWPIQPGQPGGPPPAGGTTPPGTTPPGTTPPGTTPPGTTPPGSSGTRENYVKSLYDKDPAQAYAYIMNGNNQEWYQKNQNKVQKTLGLDDLGLRQWLGNSQYGNSLQNIQNDPAMYKSIMSGYK